MTQQQSISKSELLDALRSSEREIADKLGALSSDDFEQGRYENGWNGREILAHIASIAWTYPRLIDVAEQAASPSATEKPGEAQATSAPASGGTSAAPARGGILSYNDRQVQKRAEMSVEELLAEFRQNRAATIAAVERADEALLDVHIRSAGGIPGPLGGVIYLVAVVHVLAHANDIVGS